MEETEQLLINKESTPSLFVGNVRKLNIVDELLLDVESSFRSSKTPTKHKQSFVKLSKDTTY